MMFLLGAEETQQAKSISSNVPSTAAGAKPVQQMAKTEAASVVKSSSGPHHKMAGVAAARVPGPGGGLLQRPIRPTQVEPSRPEVPSLMAVVPAGKPQQQMAPFRPPPPHRLLLVPFCH